MNAENYRHIAIALGSLTGFYLARMRGVENWYPYTVGGSIAGALIGEIIMNLTPGEDEQ